MGGIALEKDEAHEVTMELKKLTMLGSDARRWAKIERCK